MDNRRAVVDESIRAADKPRTPWSGWSERTSPWTIPGSLLTLAAALWFTFAYVPRWQFLVAGLLIAAAAPLGWLGVRPNQRGALAAGIAALVLIVAGVVLVAQGAG